MSVQLDTPPRFAATPPIPGPFRPRGDMSPTVTPRALGPFFWLASHAPRLTAAVRPLAVRLVPLASRTVRRRTRRNATRILGRTLAPAEEVAFTRGVVDSFYRFIADVGRSGREPVARLLARIDRVDGEDAYRALRARGRGAVLVTAHMGSFEVGLAALTRVERRVHVVFKRDASGPFESMRTRMRRRIGVVEAPVDDGLGTWTALREALANADVVVMQGDRAHPGQRTTVVPFLHGHLRVPTGPVRLARLAGTPIIPVFTVRLPSGRFLVSLHPAIDPGTAHDGPDSTDPAILAVARSIEIMVAAYPTQWLVLGAAFEEDVGHD